MGELVVLTDYESIAADSYPEGVEQWGSNGDLKILTEYVEDVSELKDGRVRIDFAEERTHIPNAEVVAYHG